MRNLYTHGKVQSIKPICYIIMKVFSQSNTRNKGTAFTATHLTRVTFTVNWEETHLGIVSYEDLVSIYA